MRLTKTNFWDNVPIGFWKATFSGVDYCFMVDSPNEDTFEPGYVCGSMFQSLKNEVDLNHLDHRSVGFFTEKEEAIEDHRQFVLDFIQNLNDSTFQSNPIKIC